MGVTHALRGLPRTATQGIALCKEMDARREAQLVVKTTGKARNDADVPYRRNPLGLSAIVEPNPNFGRGHAECLDRLPGAERP